METFKNTVLGIGSDKYNIEQLVSILVLCASKLEVNTISEMARIENKTPRGIRTSKQYRKITIGKQVFAIKGLSDSGLPF